MIPTRIYCDYNATAPLRPEAAAAVAAALTLGANPSSVHAEGRRARAALEAARDQVAAAVGACRDDLVFTSGGTEAVFAPLRGAQAMVAASGGCELLVSSIEHDAVASLAIGAEPLGVDTGGVLDLAELEDRVKATAARGVTPLVSLMLVNNETGVVQPIAEAAAIVHGVGGLVHCDAVQALGKIVVSTFELDVDYLSVSSHKIGGPQGVGAFYVRAGAPFRPSQTGGGQEFGRRAGTENVAGAAGFGAACEAATAALEAYAALGPHRDRMEARLRRAAPRLVVHGLGRPRIAGTSCFGVEGLPAETQIMALDLAGFALSAGAACSSGKVRASRVLTAMGVSEEAGRCAVRASFGWASAPKDFEALATAWLAMAARARPHLVAQEALADVG